MHSPFVSWFDALQTRKLKPSVACQRETCLYICLLFCFVLWKRISTVWHSDLGVLSFGFRIFFFHFTIFLFHLWLINFFMIAYICGRTSHWENHLNSGARVWLICLIHRNCGLLHTTLLLQTNLFLFLFFSPGKFFTSMECFGEGTNCTVMT